MSAKCFGLNRFLMFLITTIVCVVLHGCSAWLSIPRTIDGWIFPRPNLWPLVWVVMQNMLAYYVGSYLFPKVMIAAEQIAQAFSFGKTRIAFWICYLLQVGFILLQVSLTFAVAYLGSAPGWLSFAATWFTAAAYLSFFFGCCISDPGGGKTTGRLLTIAWVLSVLCSVSIVFLPISGDQIFFFFAMVFVFSAFFAALRIERAGCSFDGLPVRRLKAVCVVFVAILFYCGSICFWRLGIAPMSHRLTVLNFVQKAPPCDLLKLRELSISGERPANYMFLICAANNTMLAVEKMMEISRVESVANTCVGFTNVMGLLRRDANGNIATLNRKAFDETEEDAEFTKRLRKSNTNIAHTQLSASFVSELCSRVSADCNSKGKESVKEVFFLAFLRRKGPRLCSIGSRTFNCIRFYDNGGRLEDCVLASEIMAVRSLAEIATSEDGILNEAICGWYLLKKREEKGMVFSRESDVLAALEKTFDSGDYTEKLHHVWTHAIDGESVVKIRNELMRVASAGDGFSLWAWLLNLFGSLAVSRLFDKIVGWVPRRYRFWLRFASKGGAQRGSFR